MSWVDMTDLDLIAWYKADAISGYSDMDPLSVWADDGPGSLDLSSALTARPLYRDSQVNSLPAVKFDGSDDMMSSASFVLDRPISFAVVARFDVVKTYQMIIDCYSTNVPLYPSDRFLLMVYNTFRSIIGSDGTYCQFSPPVINPYIVGDWYIIYGTLDADHSRLRINGYSVSVYATAGSVSQTGGTTYVNVGTSSLSGSPLNGAIAEMILFDSSAYDNQEIWVEGYLSHKYGITLAAGHLFRNDAPAFAPTGYNSAGGMFRRSTMRGGY